MTGVGERGVRRGFVAILGAALALGMLGVVGGASPANAAPGDGSISGTVALGGSGLGWVGPMDSVTVNLMDQNGVVLALATPAPDGTFSFGSLADGYYALGFAYYMETVYPNQYWPQTFTFEEAGLIEIEGGQAVTGVTKLMLSWKWVLWSATMKAPGNRLCFGLEGVAHGWSDTECYTGGLAPGSSVGVPPGDTYIIWAYEYDPVTGFYTDTLYWNNTGADRRLRSNATPYVPNSLSFPPGGPATNFRLDLLPWLGTDSSTDIVVTTSVAPLYVGAQTTLTATVTGASGTPTGVIGFYDERGFIGDAVLSGGQASVPYAVTHAGADIMAVWYRGDTVYDIAGWDLNWVFRPTVDAVTPGFGPTAGGTVVTLDGYAFTGATAVTFDGVAGTELLVGSDTQLTVTAPPGVDPQAEVMVTGGAWDSVATPGAFFAYTDARVAAGTPTRIVDVAGFTPGVVRCFPVVGLAGVPVGATGVVLNVTTAGPSNGGYVVVYPDRANNGRTPAPNSSTVNFEPGRDVANSATVALPANGDVCAYSQGGTIGRLILDVAGFMVPGSGIMVQNPVRLLDTRAGYHVGELTGPVVPGVVNTIQVTGNAGVPAGATAVVANVTVTSVAAGGHLRMWEAGIPVPNTSVVNYAPGQTKANGQIIALSAEGELSFQTFGTSAEVIIDVTGYVTAGADFHATAPTRIVETRAQYGAVGIPSALLPNTPYAVELDESLVPLTATAVVMNVTAVNPTAGGNLRVYPDTNGSGTTAPPLASNLNYIPYRAIPNMVVVQIPPNRTIDFYNNQANGASRTDLIVDVIGYIDNTTL